MAEIVNKATTQVTVNGEQAESMLTALEKKAKKYKDAMVAANSAGDVKGFNKAKKGLQDVNREMNKIVRSSFDVNKVLNNLSTVGPKQLRAAISAINKEINKPHIKRGTKEYNELANKLKLVKAELAKVNAEQNVGESFWSKASGRFNKHFAMLGTILASITGISFAFRKLSEDVAAMDDIYADVMKTTGMTRDEVLDLNEAFKAMDTRTSREQLNMLARDAGKLGLQGKEDILQFVEAANVIDVALGEDLGEGAIRNVGKLVDVFKLSTREMDNLDLKGRMLAVGSAVNELGANSSANEGYLVSFAGRLGGIAAQANLSLQNVLAYGSVLDQNMQAVEMSGTAFQKLIMKMLAEPEKFARMAGIELGKFNKLLKEDTNEAILQVLEKLGGKGGLHKLIPIFKDLGLDAARAAQVISSMAGSVDKIREAQEISNDAFVKGTSVLDEYAIKNNNLQAKLEKARKEFKDQALTLGEHLNPVLLKSTNLMTYVVKLLPSLIDFFSKYGKYLGLVVTAGLAYVAGVKLQTFWNTKLAASLSLTNIQIKLKTAYLIASEAAIHLYYIAISILNGRLKDARRSFIAFSAVIKANPFGFFLGILTAVAGAIYLLNKRTKEMNALHKANQTINKKVNEELEAQRSKIDVLTDTINNESLALNVRRRALEELQRIVPQYHANLTEEGTLINNNTEAIESYLVSLEKQIRLKAAQEELEELYRKKRLQEKTVESKQAKADTARAASQTVILGQSSYASSSSAMLADQAQRFANQAKKELADTENAITSIRDEIQKAHKDFGKSTVEIDEEEIAARQRFNAMNLKELQLWINDEKNAKDKYLSIAKEILAIRQNELNPQGDSKAEEQRKTMQAVLRKLEIEHNQEINKIKQDYLDGRIVSESDYNAKLLNQQNAYDKKRIDNLNILLDKGILIDETVRQEALNQKEQFDQQILDREIKRQAELRKILLDADPLETEKENYEKRLRELGLYGIRRENMTAEQLEASFLLEKQYMERVAKLERPEARTKIAGFNRDYANEAEVLAQYHAQGLLNERQYQHQLLLLDIAYTVKKLQIKELSEEQYIQLQRESQEKQRKLLEENSDIQGRLNKKTKVENLEESRDAELAFLDQAFTEDLQHTEAYEQARLAIIQKYALLEEEQDKEKRSRMLETTQFALESLSTLMSSYSSLVQAANEAEVAAVNQKYDKLIKAAGKNQKAVSKLEEQRDEELKEINRENEERSFKIQVAQALASTAQAAINAYSSTAAIPIIGPTLAPIAAGVATVAGMVNVAAIRKQHEAAMANYWTGGYTPKGPKYGYAGNVHFGEFVGNAEAVRNPYANAVFDVVDIAQRNNTLSSLTPNDFVTALNYREQVASMPNGGGAMSGGSSVNSPSNEELIIATNQMAEAAEKLNKRLDEPIVAETYYKGRNGIEEVTRKAQTLDKNVKRK